MNAMMWTRSFRTIALGAAASVVLYMSGFLVLFTPLPLACVFIRSGRLGGGVSSIIALIGVIVLYAFAIPNLGGGAVESSASIGALPGVGLNAMVPLPNVLFGSAYFLFFAGIAASIGEGANAKGSFARWAGISMAVGYGIIASMVLITYAFIGASLISGMQSYIESAIAEVVELDISTNLSRAQMHYLSANRSQIAAFLVALIPSLAFVFVSITVVVNTLLTRRFVRLSRTAGRMRQAVSFRLPDCCIWVVIVSGATFFAGHYVVHAAWMKLVAINGLIAMGAIYFFQGFAVAAYFLERVRPRIVRLLCYIGIVFFFQTVGFIIVGLGLADVWIRFRRRSSIPMSS